MSGAESRPPIAPGEPAPDFTLPTLDQDGTVSLADYRGRSPVLLALLVGLWCPFCRRAIVQLGTTQGKLKALGVEALGIVATAAENARLYVRFRPTRLRLAADPELTTHGAYGLPRPAPTPELMQEVAAVRINPTGELPEPLPIPEASGALDRLDGYSRTDGDQADFERQWSQSQGQFLIDRDGIVRWTFVEGAAEGLAAVGKFPGEEQILAAARALPPH